MVQEKIPFERLGIKVVNGNYEYGEIVENSAQLTIDPAIANRVYNWFQQASLTNPMIANNPLHIQTANAIKSRQVVTTDEIPVIDKWYGELSNRRKLSSLDFDIYYKIVKGTDDTQDWLNEMESRFLIYSQEWDNMNTDSIYTLPQNPIMQVDGFPITDGAPVDTSNLSDGTSDTSDPTDQMDDTNDQFSSLDSMDAPSIDDGSSMDSMDDIDGTSIDDGTTDVPSVDDGSSMDMVDIMTSSDGTSDASDTSDATDQPDLTIQDVLDDQGISYPPLIASVLNLPQQPPDDPTDNVYDDGDNDPNLKQLGVTVKNGAYQFD